MMDDPVYNTIDNDVTLIDILLSEIFYSLKISND